MPLLIPPAKARASARTDGDPPASTSETPWLALLAPLREALTGRDAWGKRGSLRWLERAVTARGGRGGSVRNILYKNLGSFEEKRRLYDLFVALYDEAGLSTPAQPSELRSAGAKRALGRDKRLLFARFVRDYGAAQRPQLVVVGSAAAGKSVLLESVYQALPESLFLNLAHDLSPALFLLAETLGVADAYERLGES